MREVKVIEPKDGIPAWIWTGSGYSAGIIEIKQSFMGSGRMVWPGGKGLSCDIEKTTFYSHHPETGVSAQDQLLKEYTKCKKEYEWFYDIFGDLEST